MTRLLVLAATLAVAVTARAADPPPELALVPADAVGVIHVRAADLWKHPSLAGYRAMVDKAGADALAELDRQFRPRPGTLDRLTGFVVLPPGDAPPQVVALVRFAQPIDAEKVRAVSLADARAVTVAGKTFHVVGPDAMAVHFVDAHTIALSDEAGMRGFVSRKPAAGETEFGKLFRESTDKPVVLAVRPKRLPIPPDALAQVPADFRPLLAADLVSLTVGLDPVARATVRLEYPNAEAADAAEVAVRAGLDMLKPWAARQRAEAAAQLKGAGVKDGERPLAELPQAIGGLLGLASAAELEALIAAPPLKRAGTALSADVVMPGGFLGTTAVTAVGIGLLLPAVQKVREAASRTQSQNNLKMIGLALHNYESAYGKFPPAAITDKKTGKPLLSWRVAILPYMEQENLYRQFKLDEPWDSPNNLPLSKILIKVYTDPRAPAEPGMTFYKAFVGKDAKDQNGRPFPGPDALWSLTLGRQLLSITDGLSNTAMVGAFGPPMVWTKPDDFFYDPKQPLPDLFAPFTGLNVVLGDGSVRFIDPGVDPTVLRAMITSAGGEVFAIP